MISRLEAEADEMWSFVQKKANKPWIWIAMDATTRQIIAFHVGDRSGESGKELWANIPTVYREQATFHTDQYAVYTGVIPAAQHRAITKKARKTNHIERFNNTLGNVCLVWCARRSHSPKSWRTTSAPSSISFATTISREEQHYLSSTTRYRAGGLGLHRRQTSQHEATAHGPRACAGTSVVTGDR